MTAGILCLIYYVVLCITTQKVRSTFAVFWLFLGAGCILAEQAVKWMPVGVRSVFNLVILAFLVVFLTVETRMILAARRGVPGGISYVIVLGAQVRGKRVTDSLKRRLDVAFAYAAENPDCILIVSGGQGKDEEISEARAMKHYLCRRGLAKERIYVEEHSFSTYENLKNSREFIKDMEEKVAIATNDFHVFRALYFARKLGYTHVFGLPSGTKMWLRPNYMVREFFAVCKGLAVGKQ